MLDAQLAWRAVLTLLVVVPWIAMATVGMLDAQLAWRAVLTLLVVVPWIATMALALIDQAEWEHYQDMKFRVRATGRWTNPRA